MPPHYAELEPPLLVFGRVPTLEPRNLLQTMREIHTRREERRPSYGAYVIRKGGEQVWEQAASIACVQAGTPIWSEDSFGPGYGRYSDVSTLHIDVGEANDITAHWTKAGRAEGVILLGVAGNTYLEEYSAAITEKIFIEGRFASQVQPTRALRITLEADDVLLFDHSEFHGFRSLDSARYSTAAYPFGDTL